MPALKLSYALGLLAAALVGTTLADVGGGGLAEAHHARSHRPLSRRSPAQQQHPEAPPSLSRRASSGGTVMPDAPGPGAVFQSGKPCTMHWSPAPASSTAWKAMTISLMTGENEAMVHLADVATNVDATTTTSYSFPCPQVDPYSAIYFYQFSAPSGSGENKWTTRFAISDPETGKTTPPPQAKQPSGESIPWGIGKLVSSVTTNGGSSGSGGVGASTSTSSIAAGNGSDTNTSSSSSSSSLGSANGSTNSASSSAAQQALTSSGGSENGTSSSSSNSKGNGTTTTTTTTTTKTSGAQSSHARGGGSAVVAATGAAAGTVLALVVAVTASWDGTAW